MSLTIIGAAIAALITAILAAFVAGDRNRKAKDKADAKQDDYEHAADIRRNVADNRADELRKHDSAGWRD